MSKLLKSKYNNSGDRCVDACLSYGELRYLDHEGQPINIEVPEDKYEEAIIDFTERKKEGLVSSSIDPIKVLKKGSFTYNQVKNIANLNKIKGLRVFEIDRSIELEHTLGVSGSIEYALAIWNGDSKEVALEKAIIRAIKIHGVNFVKSLKGDNSPLIYSIPVTFETGALETKEEGELRLKSQIDSLKKKIFYIGKHNISLGFIKRLLNIFKKQHKQSFIFLFYIF